MTGRFDECENIVFLLTQISVYTYLTQKHRIMRSKNDFIYFDFWLSCVLVVVVALDLTVTMPAGAALTVVLTFGYALISVSDLLRFSFCLSPVCGSQTDLNPISHPYQMLGGATS